MGFIVKRLKKLQMIGSLLLIGNVQNHLENKGMKFKDTEQTTELKTIHSTRRIQSKSNSSNNTNNNDTKADLLIL